MHSTDGDGGCSGGDRSSSGSDSVVVVIGGRALRPRQAKPAAQQQGGGGTTVHLPPCGLRETRKHGLAGVEPEPSQQKARKCEDHAPAAAAAKPPIAACAIADGKKFIIRLPASAMPVPFAAKRSAIKALAGTFTVAPASAPAVETVGTAAAGLCADDDDDDEDWEDDDVYAETAADLTPAAAAPADPTLTAAAPAVAAPAAAASVDPTPTAAAPAVAAPAAAASADPTPVRTLDIRRESPFITAHADLICRFFADKQTEADRIAVEDAYTRCCKVIVSELAAIPRSWCASVTSRRTSVQRAADVIIVDHTS